MLREVCKHRRNHVMHDNVVIPAGFSGEVDYDVITESIIENDEDFKHFMEPAIRPEIAEPYREDEANLFDQDSMRFLFVEVNE